MNSRQTKERHPSIFIELPSRFVHLEPHYTYVLLLTLYTIFVLVSFWIDGVPWQGYALTRPCLSCDGQCPSLWTRNLAASHDHRQAQWEGHCVLRRSASQMPRVPQDKRSNGFVRLEATAPINNAMNTSMSALTKSSASISTTTKNATIIPSTATTASSAAVAI